MTKILYYDCAIQAAYMAKEFGVKFDRPIPEYRVLDGEPFQEGSFYGAKAYISIESESIFQPKEGDFGKLANGFLVSSFYKGRWRVFPDLRSNDSIDKSEIIMREDKLFFTPKQEDNDQ